jgi:hypothetical protein
VEYLGRSGNQVLFVKDSLGAIIDEDTKTVVRVDDHALLSMMEPWDATGYAPKAPISELANAAMTDLDIKVFAQNDRMYTIPDAVIAEAKRGLAWRKEENRGGTPVGLNSARTLAAGGQIGIRKVRHIAKYFPRHEVDKKAKGYRPGEDNYPSNGRIAWALWGGDAAKRWASAIVERENKKKNPNASIVASHGMYDYDPMDRYDYDSFNPSMVDPEFFIRICLDGSGIDRLYKVESDGSVFVWDDGCWDDLGHIEHDFETYDKTLDDPYDKRVKIHAPLDRESAVKVAAMLDNFPLEHVDIKKIDFDESEIFERAISEVDWRFVDQLSDDEIPSVDDYDDLDGLLAAGEQEGAPQTNQDGNYTPEERSEKASKQPRDSTGRFSTVGQTVVIGKNPNYKGKITALNPEKSEVSVLLDNGNTVNVPSATTQEVSTFQPVSKSNVPTNDLDFTGILGEPRAPIDQPLAQLPGRLPALTAPATNLLVNDWSAWVASQRLAPDHRPELKEDPFVPKEVPDINTAMGEYYKGAFKPDGTLKPDLGWNPALAPNLYNEPLLRDWLDKQDKNAPWAGWYKDVDKSGTEAQKTKKQVNSKKNQKEMDKKWDPKNFSSITAAGQEEVSPEASDVAAIYMAIVAEDDPQAVMDLICLIPAGKDTTQGATFKRKPGKWERDDKVLADLKSPTPPPVIVLSNEMLSDVVKQIDGNAVTASLSISFDSSVALSNNRILSALIAAGGVDRNRGNAEKLRRYWTVGKGGLKIRWNSPGDWTRCYKQLAKYMGPRAKGYCALRHKEMTGTWPGSKNNIGKKKKRAIKASAEIETVKTEELIVSEFTLKARADSARSRVVGREGVSPTEFGSKFVIPLVIPEDIETGDGRIFKKGSISMRDLPLPLLWQIKTGQGHDGSVVVGQITHMERVGSGIGNAYGVFDTGSLGQEAERLVKHGFIRGVSADMDKFEADEQHPEDAGDDSEDSQGIKSSKIIIKNARIMAVTIVPKPAFQECYIQIVDDGNESEEEQMTIPDGIYVDGVNPLDASALVACGLVAGAIPVEPPTEWFNNPKLDKATPLTVTDEGRVFGHIAAWHVDHIGMAFGTRPPRSRSKYSYFHTGVIRTAEGTDVPVGQLTLAGGHAGLEASAEEAVRHYDDTASAFADVHAGEDAFGIWVSGSLRPGTSPEQIRAARASAPSGDWRPIKGHLELVAVCQVNVPGFPIARARVASGQVMALVAAGAQALAQLKNDPLAELNAKIDRLELIARQTEIAELSEKVTELSSRVKASKEDMGGSWEYMIQMMDDDPEQEMSIIPRRERQRLAQEGKALPDLSFPIRNVADLKAAVRAYGRAKPGKKGEVRKHIMRRARGLDRKDLIPQEWKNASIHEPELSVRDRAVAAAASLEFKQFSPEEREELSKKGQALPDGSYPIRNESDLKNAIQAYGRSNPEDRAKVRTHIRKRARALGGEELIPEGWKSASLYEEELAVFTSVETEVESENEVQ